MELTTVHVKVDADRQPNYVVVSLTDPLLFRCPMLFMEDVGTAEFSEAEVQRAARVLPEGRLSVGRRLLGQLRVGQLGRSRSAACCRRASIPIFDIPLNHPIMHTLYDVKDYLQVSSIKFWSRTSGSVSERGSDSAQVHYRGIQDAHGRLMVMMTHNTDVADTWEREGESQRVLRSVLAARLRHRRQRRAVRDDALGVPNWELRIKNWEFCIPRFPIPNS